MPPKPKYTREEIVSAAYELARENGLQAVVAREVGRRLNTSASPIFTVFNSMEELQTAVIDRAWETFSDYLRLADEYIPTFKMRGMRMVHFAQQEPQLFQLLFMRNQGSMSFDALMESHITGFQEDLRIIQQDYGVNMEQASRLFHHVWVHAYGLCSLCATGVCRFTDEELAELLGEPFAGMLMLMNSGSRNHTRMPAHRDSAEGRSMNYPLPDLTAHR